MACDSYMLLSFRAKFRKLSRAPWSSQRFCQRGMYMRSENNSDVSGKCRHVIRVAWLFQKLWRHRDLCLQLSCAFACRTHEWVIYVIVYKYVHRTHALNLNMFYMSIHSTSLSHTLSLSRFVMDVFIGSKKRFSVPPSSSVFCKSWWWTEQDLSDHTTGRKIQK
jgi:hypothetical protein